MTAKASFVLFALLVINFVLFSTALNRCPNSNRCENALASWKCEGCTLDKAEINGAVNIALNHEPRDIYLSLSLKWLDALLEPKSHVIVTQLDFKLLPEYSPKDPPIPQDLYEEEFQVIFSLLPESEIYDHTNQGVVDSFLAKVVLDPNLFFNLSVNLSIFVKHILRIPAGCLFMNQQLKICQITLRAIPLVSVFISNILSNWGFFHHSP